MISRPIQTSQSYFLELLERLLAEQPPSRVELGDSTVGRSLRGDPPPYMMDIARLSIILEGRMRYTLCQQRQWQDIELSPGHAIYLARHAWLRGYWGEPFLAFGIVFSREFVRFIITDHTGGPRPEVPTPWAYHTAHPISEAGALVTWALDALAEQDDSAATLPLFMTLLHLAHEHLQRDEPSNDEYSGRASYTWRRVQDYLHENYSQPISRASVARALHLNPCYLSTLCAREGGASFQRALETIRIERAQHLLKQADLDMKHIAQLCGFSGTVQFSRAFQRATGVTPHRHRNAVPKPAQQEKPRRR